MSMCVICVYILVCVCVSQTSTVFNLCPDTLLFLKNQFPFSWKCEQDCWPSFLAWGLLSDSHLSASLGVYGNYIVTVCLQQLLLDLSQLLHFSLKILSVYISGTSPDFLAQRAFCGSVPVHLWLLHNRSIVLQTQQNPLPHWVRLFPMPSYFSCAFPSICECPLP